MTEYDAKVRGGRPAGGELTGPVRRVRSQFNLLRCLDAEGEKPMDARNEPRWMTVADLLGLVAGFAVGIKLFQLGGGFVWIADDDLASWDSRRSYAILLPAARTILSAVAFVVLERQVLFRRAARPAEWFALIFLAQSVALVFNELELVAFRDDRSPMAAFEAHYGFAGELAVFALAVGLYFTSTRVRMSLLGVVGGVAITYSVVLEVRGYVRTVCWQLAATS